MLRKFYNNHVTSVILRVSLASILDFLEKANTESRIDTGNAKGSDILIDTLRQSHPPKLNFCLKTSSNEWISKIIY